MELAVKPKGALRGSIKVPGDKSISHRSVIFGSLARGITEIHGFLPAEDTLRTVECFKKMGINIKKDEDLMVIKGEGLWGLQEPEDVLDAGNSGTTARLLIGLLAGNPFYSVLTGDSSLKKRPMDRVVEPLKEMGALVYGRQGANLLPLTVMGGNLKGIDYVSPVASAQVKSALLLAGLYAKGPTAVTEPYLSRDHTERMMKYFGINIEVKENRVQVEGPPEIEGKRVEVPGDFSSAAFFIVAASLLPGSSLRIEKVGVNPTRTGLLKVLKDMGASITLERERIENEEPVADIKVEYAPLRGVEIRGDLIPRLIDEIPVLAVAASLAEGKTVIREASELRVKESDRIDTIVKELIKMGAKIEGLPDGLVIEGTQKLKGALCESHGDHRIAMAAAVAGLTAQGDTLIRDSGCINISFPGFTDTLKSL